MAEITEKLVETDPTARILRCAAELILDTGSRDLDIAQLARTAEVKRSTVYAYFGDDRDVKATIFETITNQFLGNAKQLVEAALVISDPRLSTPIEQLAAVFRATLQAFRTDPLFGRVVLQHLNLSRIEESATAFQIFAHVDQLLASAKAQHLLNDKIVDRLKTWKIRQIVFVVAHGLLRAFYLSEGKEVDNQGQPVRGEQFQETEIECEVLRVLQLYCGEAASNSIQSMIDLILSSSVGVQNSN